MGTTKDLLQELRRRFSPEVFVEADVRRERRFAHGALVLDTPFAANDGEAPQLEPGSVCGV